MTQTRPLRFALLMCAVLLAPVAARAQVACVEPGAVVAFVPQQEGWVIGSIGGSVPAGGCFYDLPVTKDWTIRLTPSGPIRVTVEARGLKLTDPVRPFKAPATGSLRIGIRPSVPGTGAAAYDLVMDLRKPGL